jgi:hypothetical protein
VSRTAVQVALLCFGLAGTADAADVLRGSLDPVVPLDEVTFTVEGRVWFSTGQSDWSHNATSSNPNFGNPTSRLQYKDQTGATGEIEIRGDEATGLFGRALVGLGGIVDGTLRDRDWFSGQVLFSDTVSKVEEGNLRYVAVDGGWALDGLSTEVLRTSMFVGYGYWGEKSPAFGLRCNADDVGNIDCPLGIDLIGRTTPAITNDLDWHMLRIGLEGSLRVGSVMTLSAEFAAIPIAIFYNEDSHHHRVDLGQTPNILHEGNGYGFQAQAMAKVDLSPEWSIGVGARYWHLSSYNNPNLRFGGRFGIPLPVNDFDTRRYGVLAASALKF